MKKLILLFVAIVFSLPTEAQQRLTLIHLNDTHSHIDPQRAGVRKGQGGVIEQAAYIDSVRHADGKKNVLLLHAGDFGQGTSYFTELKGNIEIDVLNAFEVDAISLGNHEFDNGIDELARRISNLDSPVLCANYSFEGTALEGLVEPYTIVRKAGYKIGIIGLLTDVTKVVDQSVAAGMKYLDPIQIANQYAKYLKEVKACDMVICLTHIGFGASSGPGNDLALADASRNIDLIVGGHSHTFLDDASIRRNVDGQKVPVVQNGCWGLEMGHMFVWK